MSEDKGGGRVVREGHFASLEYMASEAFLLVMTLFETEPEFGGVYFRPVNNSVTVVDLHPGSPKPRIGVGDDPGIRLGATAAELAPTLAARVQYLREVRGRQTTPSRENQLEARLIREAQGDRLRMPGLPERLRFIYSQWRMAPAGCKSQRFPDLLAVDLQRRELVLIELKRGPNHGAGAQVQGYEQLVRNAGPTLMRFFLKAARVMGQLHHCPELAGLEQLGSAPVGITAWPEGEALVVTGLARLDEERSSRPVTLDRRPPRRAVPGQNQGPAHEIGPQPKPRSSFEARMRLHQCWYRSRVLKAPYGTGPEHHHTRLLGSMLSKPDGARGRNFLTPTIFQVAKERIAEGGRSVAAFRLLHNMLSSMPMCFNLFGELASDSELARLLLDGLAGLDVGRIRRVRVEWAPAPLADYLNDGTSFDAFIDYFKRDGTRAFVGVETKLADTFSSGSYDRSTYRRWMDGPNAPFLPGVVEKASESKYNQLWRDHLLAIALRDNPDSPYQEGALMLVRHPDDGNGTGVSAGYRELLRPDEPTFIDMPLDRLVDKWAAHLESHPALAWLEKFALRYLRLEHSEDL